MPVKKDSKEDVCVCVCVCVCLCPGQRSDVGGSLICFGSWPPTSPLAATRVIICGMCPRPSDVLMPLKQKKIKSFFFSNTQAKMQYAGLV